MLGLGLSVTQIAARLRPLAAAIRSLFASGEQGVWYDPSDLSTLYQDAAGTTPVTAVEQPVGLMLDKSKGLVLGPELVTNGDFSNGTTGWSVAAGVGGTIAVVGGELELTSNGGGILVSSPISTVIGKTYSLFTTARNGTYTGATIGAATTNTSTPSPLITVNSGTNSQYRLVFTATQETTFINIRFPTTFAGTSYFDNISVRELPGNHAYQTTSVNRPVLSARYNLLTKTEQFDDGAVWIAANATKASTSEISPIGTPTAAKLNLEAVSSGSYSLLYRTPVPLQGTLTDSLWIKGQSGTEIVYLFYLVDGVYKKKRCVLTTEWQRFSFDFEGGSLCYWHVGIDTRSGSGQEARPAQTIYIWGADLRVANDGVNLPPYQRVNTATDYDTVGFPPYLSFNGSNQWLQTNSIDFSATDKVTVFAGVRKLSDAAVGRVVILTDGTWNAGTFSVGAPYGAPTANYGMLSRGTLVAELAIGTYAAPITNILTGIGDISGDKATLRINGALAASSAADQGTGNYISGKLFIGSRGVAAEFLNGRIYSLIARGAQSTDQQIIDAERYVNDKTRAY